MKTIMVDFTSLICQTLLLHRLRFALLLKIGFVTIDTPRDSEKLCIRLQSQTTTTTLLKIEMKISVPKQ